MSPRLLLLVCIALSPRSSVAQNVEARAHALLERSRQLSDIRSPDSPAFRMKATFSFIGDDLEETKGTYTETWISASQWRRETVVGDLHYIEIASKDKRWLVYPERFPEPAERLPSVLTLTPPASLELDFSAIQEERTGNLTAVCAYSKPLLPHADSVFCYEKVSGALLQKAIPQIRPRNIVQFSCEYGTFHHFGQYYFPREAECFEDRHKSISASVVELSLEPPIDPALFSPPPDAIELALCLGKSTAPRLSINLFEFPGLDPDRVSWTAVWFVVDLKGKPQDLRVARAPGRTSHEKAFETVRSWHFLPGTCDGKPVPMATTMEVPSTPK